MGETLGGMPDQNEPLGGPSVGPSDGPGANRAPEASPVPPEPTTVVLQDTESPDTREKIFRQASKRFERVKTYEHNCRSYARDDLKFAHGDAYNGYQWPVNIRQNRERDQKPCLTLNRTQQHNLMIINDAKQNKPGIMVRPTGNEASYESAQVLESVIRHIEYQSKASIAYDISTEFQVEVGYGAIRVRADYISDDTFDQDIFIESCRRPDLVYFDPDAKEVDRSDAKWAFVVDEVPLDDFDDIYPQYAGQTQVFSEPSDEWRTKQHVRVAEYFWIETAPDTLYQFTDPHDGSLKTIRGAMMTPALEAKLQGDKSVRKRRIMAPKVKWALIVGTNVAELRDIPCQFIPLVPVIGRETFIDGQYDRMGHTRALLDPQRMYNYWSSQAVEQVALMSKTPWVAPAAAIEGQEVYWNTANTVNYSVLVWNHLDDEGNPIPPPQRQEPPSMASAYLQGMQVTQQEMMMVSGQFQSQMGEASNERSATSIQQRQRQGDVATYHFIDNLAIAIRQVGRIVMDMIPRIYDTARVIQAQGEDGISFEVQIDPQAAQAYQAHRAHDGQVAKHVLNPMLGRYEVEADVGPAWGTKREQAAEAFAQILAQAPQLAPVIGDIYFRNLDIPMANEAAERLKRGVPKELLGQGPSQTEQQLQGQLQKTQALLAKIWGQLVEAKSKQISTEQLRDIDAYDSETKRIAALAKVFPEADPQGLHEILEQLVGQTLQTQLTPLVKDLTDSISLAHTQSHGSVLPPLPAEFQTQPDNAPGPTGAKPPGAP